MSSCMLEFSPRVACFGVEDDEQLAGKREADDRLRLSRFLQLAGKAARPGRKRRAMSATRNRMERGPALLVRLEAKRPFVRARQRQRPGALPRLWSGSGNGRPCRARGWAAAQPGAPPQIPHANASASIQGGPRSATERRNHASPLFCAGATSGAGAAKTGSTSRNAYQAGAATGGVPGATRRRSIAAL